MAPTSATLPEYIDVCARKLLNTNHTTPSTSIRSSDGRYYRPLCRQFGTGGCTEDWPDCPRMEDTPEGQIPRLHACRRCGDQDHPMVQCPRPDDDVILPTDAQIRGPRQAELDEARAAKGKGKGKGWGKAWGK